MAEVICSPSLVIAECRVSSGCPYEIIDVNSAGRFHNQSEADFFKASEYHDQTGIFIGQLDHVITLAADGILDQCALPEYPEYMAGLHTFTGTEVYGNDVKLANLGDTAQY